MENRHAAMDRSLNQSLPPTSTIDYYPYQNCSVVHPARQQLADNNYENTQIGDISGYNQVTTKPAAVATVRSVIAINEGDEKPDIVNQESAVFSKNSKQNKAAAVEHSVANIMYGVPYFVKQNSADFINNNQNNAESNETITQYSGQEMSTSVALIQPITTTSSTIQTNPDDFPGELNFQFFINSDQNYKKSFVYSKLLNKAFISMNNPLPVQFAWKHYPSNLQVRACMIFRDSHSRNKPVQRCHAHKASDLEENGLIETLPMKFTFRTNQQGSLYQEDRATGFLSIVTPAGLPNPGRDCFQVDYHFLCMTSCVTGINRRATFLVFTLENEDSFVFGKCSLPIHICCCPKRDMEKEEKNIGNPHIFGRKLNKSKKSASHPSVPRTQYISNLTPPISSLSQSTMNLPKPMPALSPHNEDEVFELHLKIVGGEEYLSVLNFAYGLILKDAYENNAIEKHRKDLNAIRQKIEEYKRIYASL